MRDKILFVDDEPAFLTGYELMLRDEFEVHTAVGGPRGLVEIQDRGPYAVVVSDMRMPGMDGMQFLACVRKAAPDAIRMILTGYSDITIVMDAVNEGNVFRFLTKPCEQSILAKAVASGLAQYRLLRSEKELLENTLMGSIKVLTDVLSTVSPEAFGRSIRITRCVRHMVAKLQMPPSWCLEAAAMLSQLGCIALDPELIQAAFFDTHLSADQRARFETHPIVAMDLLANIQRLESVAWMIAQQFRHDPQNVLKVSEFSEEFLMIGARMLRVATAFDNLKMRGASSEEAVLQLRYRSEFDRKLVDSLADIKPYDSKMELRKLAISNVTVGTILQQDVRNHVGLLIVAKGQEVTRPLLSKLEYFSRARMIDSEVVALVPV